MRARRGRVFSFALGAAVSLATLCHAPGDANAEPADAPSAPTTVAVTITGDPDEARLLEETLRELLARRGLDVVAASSGVRRDAVLARADVDLGNAASPARFVVTNPKDGSIVLDRTMPREGSAAVEVEAIAHAIRSAVESELMDDGTKAGPADPPSPPSSPPPPAPSPPAPIPPVAAPTPRDAPSNGTPARSTIALDVATFAAGGFLAGGSSPIMRVGLGAALASRRGLRPSLGLSFYYGIPVDTNTPLVSSHANLVGARAMPRIVFFHGPRVDMSLAIGGGFDVMTVEPRSAVLPTSALGEDTSRVDPIFASALGVRVSLVSSVVLTFDAVFDVDLDSRRYVLDEGNAASDVFVPWRVRPSLVVGLAFTAFGEAPFAAAEAAR